MSGAQFASPEQSERPGPVRRSAQQLVVGRADDPAEREADRIADQVIARLQDGHEHAHGAEAGGHQGVHRKATSSFGPADAPEVGFEGGALSSGLSAQIDAARGEGRPLNGAVRDRMEGAFGYDLSSVRIHSGPAASTLNRQISARAFTSGRDVFFGSGEYQPDTAAGERMLAHELAHVQQHSAVRRIHRYWDFNQPKLDWTQAAAMSTLKTRFVWFLKDTAGDDMVVKLEGQPIGLSELTAQMHSQFGTAGSVRQKTLGARDKAWLSQLLQDPNIARGPSWGKFAMENKGLVPKSLPGPVDDTNAEDYGRKTALHELRTSSDGLMAMTMAAGKSAEESSKPNYGGTGYDPNVSMLRTRLEDDAHAEQLGQIMAVDLFLGNIDRVTRGNMGNWFYNPNGAVTLIDHVDQGTHQAAKFVQGSKAAAEWEADHGAGGLLKGANMAGTVSDSINQIAREASFHGDKGFKAWLDTDIGGGQTRRSRIEAKMLIGLRAERAKLIKVFTATRFTVGGGRARAAKKQLKANARDAAAADQGHSEFGGNQADYFATMKQRAAWLRKN